MKTVNRSIPVELRAKICVGCFSPRREGPICRDCGFRYDGYERSELLELSPGTILNDLYFIGSVLGSGNFGITYRGYNSKLQLKLAVKEYYPRHLAVRNRDGAALDLLRKQSQEEYRKGLDDFLAEARTVAQLGEHPNIISVKDFFEMNNTAYMVMALVKGVSVSGYLAKHDGKMDFKTAEKIFPPIMEALKAAHNINLLHRDISPDNIFITDTGEAKLLDFGSARKVMENREDSPEYTTLVKHGYSPLEQYSKKAKQGPQADIYALAATIYHVLTGQMPPAATDRAQGTKLPHLEDLYINMPGYASEAVMKALSMHPDDRFSTVEEFRSAFLGLDSAPAEIEEPAIIRPAKKSPPALHIAVAITGTLLLILSVILFFLVKK